MAKTKRKGIAEASSGLLLLLLQMVLSGPLYKSHKFRFGIMLYKIYVT